MINIQKKIKVARNEIMKIMLNRKYPTTATVIKYALEKKGVNFSRNDVASVLSRMRKDGSMYNPCEMKCPIKGTHVLGWLKI